MENKQLFELSWPWPRIVFPWIKKLQVCHKSFIADFFLAIIAEVVRNNDNNLPASNIYIVAILPTLESLIILLQSYQIGFKSVKNCKMTILEKGSQREKFVNNIIYRHDD